MDRPKLRFDYTDEDNVLGGEREGRVEPQGTEARSLWDYYLREE